jgi:hypothetical protein
MNPGDAQLRAQSELQSGESLYWTGTADPARAARSALPASIFGIPFAGFALFWMNTAFRLAVPAHRSRHCARSALGLSQRPQHRLRPHQSARNGHLRRQKRFRKVLHACRHTQRRAPRTPRRLRRHSDSDHRHHAHKQLRLPNQGSPLRRAQRKASGPASPGPALPTPRRLTRNQNPL